MNDGSVLRWKHDDARTTTGFERSKAECVDATNPGIREQARAALRRHVVEPIVARCVGREYGGFLADIDDRWRPTGPHDKALELASRTTLAFALVQRALAGAGCERLVRHGRRRASGEAGACGEGVRDRVPACR